MKSDPRPVLNPFKRKFKQGKMVIVTSEQWILHQKRLQVIKKLRQILRISGREPLENIIVSVRNLKNPQLTKGRAGYMDYVTREQVIQREDQLPFKRFQQLPISCRAYQLSQDTCLIVDRQEHHGLKGDYLVLYRKTAIILPKDDFESQYMEIGKQDDFSGPIESGLPSTPEGTGDPTPGSGGQSSPTEPPTETGLGTNDGKETLRQP